MKNITIKSVTHCPTCGSKCKVNDGTTQYYVPVKKYTEEDIQNVLDGFTNEAPGQYIKTNFIELLNKQVK